jgi:hypothetical protein
MDTKNTFDTPTTARLHRAEYAVALAVVTGLSVYHWHDIRIVPALILFFYIDLIGYIPGAIAFHRSQTKRIPKAYYLLYNTMHSALTMGAVCGLWAWLVKPEWALLAVPTHMCIDRAIFGNQLKPFSVPFEPVRLPEFDRLLAGLKPWWLTNDHNSASAPLDGTPDRMTVAGPLPGHEVTPATEHAAEHAVTPVRQGAHAR